ncbi:hypothetical protein IH781_01040 [Patescibacteria group bacterium]|nr:hypothetical protein [Patescibacteria group bacterium]
MPYLLLLTIAVVILLIPTAYAGLIGAPWAPTKLAVVKKAFDIIDLGPEDVLYDLGAGDGKIVLEAARRGALARGLELSPIMWLVAWLRTLRQPRASVTLKNFYRQSLNDATVVFIFLMPKIMPRVIDYLAKQEVPQGKVLLSYAFPLADIDPIQVIQEDGCGNIYVYDLEQLTKQQPANQPS